MRMSPEQLKAARELIGLSQLALAVQLEIGLRRVAQFEAGEPTLPEETLEALRLALEAAGVEFTTGEEAGEPLCRLARGR
jgi:transcriptional regulator with XRE-family HTH domain